MKITKLITHAGIFHADDVLCAAMMQVMNPNVVIERVFNVPDHMEEGVIIADIGGGKFDHHQEDAKCRKDGKKRAACGLLFEEIKDQLFVTKNGSADFEREYIIPIEDHDNGYMSNPLSRTVADFNPNWDLEINIDDAFNKAVKFMKDILEREIEIDKSKERAIGLVQKAFDESDGEIVELPQFAPWKDVLIESTAKFVIYPSIRGGYNLQTISVKKGSFKAKKELPNEWIDNPPKGCTFVHPGRFIAAFDSKKNAIQAAKTYAEGY